MKHSSLIESIKDIVMRLARILLFCLFGFFAWGAPCTAADTAEDKKDTEEFFIGIGGSVSTSPYKDYDTQWMPLPLVGYEGDYFYLRGLSAGVKFVNLEFLEVSAFAGYDSTSFDSSDTGDRRLKRLHNRYSSAVTGLEARLLTPYGMLHTSGAVDVLGRSNGFKGDAGYKNSFEFGALELVPAAGAYWSSSKYNDYYYGVSDKESRKSGLDDYDAGAGVSPYLGLTIDYSLTEQWEIFSHGEVVFLNRAVKDSPMVDQSNTRSLTFGVSYTF